MEMAKTFAQRLNNAKKLVRIAQRTSACVRVQAGRVCGPDEAGEYGYKTTGV